MQRAFWLVVVLLRFGELSVHAQDSFAGHFMRGSANSIYTQVSPDLDFPPEGRWFWLKSSAGNGFDVKTFNREHISMRATELTWTDNTSFKRFERDLPIAARCVEGGQAGPEIQVENTTFRYFERCQPYKTSNLGTAVNDLDAPQLMDVGGNIGQAWTRILHYHYNCDQSFHNCADEEQFYLANGYGLWQWKHYRKGVLEKNHANQSGRERDRPRQFALPR